MSYELISCHNPDVFFTQKELEVIRDRLDLVDVFVDAFELDYTEEQVLSYVSILQDHFDNSHLVCKNIFSDEVFDILKDCVEGATYLVRATEEYYWNSGLTKGEYSAIVRVCRSVEKKFKVLGFDVYFPTV